MDRKQETKAAKLALKNAGIEARVSHGTGTSRSWLHIVLKAEHFGQRREAVAIAQAATGRRTDDTINVFRACSFES